MSWTNGQIFDLIENYRRNPILWNLKRHSNYNSILVEETFKSIAENIGRDVPELKSKWRKLRITFQSIVRERSRRSETGVPEDMPKITWKFFDSMKFLLSTTNSLENLALPDCDNGLDFYENDDSCDNDVKQNVNDFLQPNRIPAIMVEGSGTNGNIISADDFYSDSMPKSKRKKYSNKGFSGCSSATAVVTTPPVVEDEPDEDDNNITTNNNNNNNISNTTVNGEQNLLNLCHNISKSFSAFCEMQKMNQTMPTYSENQAFGLYISSSLNGFEKKVASELRCTIANIIETRKRDLNI